MALKSFTDAYYDFIHKSCLNIKISCSSERFNFELTSNIAENLREVSDDLGNLST